MSLINLREEWVKAPEREAGGARCPPQNGSEVLCERAPPGEARSPLTSKPSGPVGRMDPMFPPPTPTWDVWVSPVRRPVT
eukprot:2285436-Pleurochrysis_carterae.AAC.1